MAARVGGGLHIPNVKTRVVRKTRASWRSSILIVVVAQLAMLCACVVCLGAAAGAQEIYWWNQRQQVLRVITDHRYPGADLVEQTAFVTLGYPGDVCWVIGYTTFQAEARFREVRQWYADHPAGISYFEDGRGLDRVARDRTSGIVVYRVMYRVPISTPICPER